MKSIFLLVGFIFLSVSFARAQEPVFLSPYKDGHAVAEADKDYSLRVPLNLLNIGMIKTTHENISSLDKQNETPIIPVKDEKIAPVQLNNSRNKKSSVKN